MIIGREFVRVFIDFIFRVCGLREVIEMFFLLGLVFWVCMRWDDIDIFLFLVLVFFLDCFGVTRVEE